MKREDLKVGQTVWLHFIGENAVDQEVVVSRINKTYFYVKDYLGFESMFVLDTFEEYNPNHLPTIVVYGSKEEYEQFVITEQRRKELPDLILLLDEDEVNFLYKKLEKRLNEVF